jgi:predicted amidohydrolase
MKKETGLKTDRPIEQYMALAIQPAMVGTFKREDIKRNIEHITDIIRAGYWLGGIEMQVKLAAIPEGALQGFNDELMDRDHVDFAQNMAIEIPGPETDMLGKITKEFDLYVIAQAKVKHPKIPDRFFNSAFLINPQGEVVLQSYKMQVFCREHSTVPHDVWDKWMELYGYEMDSIYAVADTNIGRIGLIFCQEGDYPEPSRGLAMNGAEIIYRASAPEPAVSRGWWEIQNRARALDNTCYVVAPNVASYLVHPEGTGPVDNFGGQSMIVHFDGHVLSSVTGGASIYAGGIIDIESLREYRERSLFGNWMKDLRTEQYKLIYEKPVFEKNLCMNRTPLKHAATDDIYRESIKRLIDQDIWAKSYKTKMKEKVNK